MDLIHKYLFITGCSFLLFLVEVNSVNKDIKSMSVLTLGYSNLSKESCSHHLLQVFILVLGSVY
jgi:hypothetical protein